MNTFKFQELTVSWCKPLMYLFIFKSDQSKGFRGSKNVINHTSCFRTVKRTDTQFSTKQENATQTSQLKNPDGGVSCHIQLLPNCLSSLFTFKGQIN